MNQIANNLITKYDTRNLYERTIGNKGEIWGSTPSQQKLLIRNFVPRSRMIPACSAERKNGTP